mgnify:CR=1 FL=1
MVTAGAVLRDRARNRDGQGGGRAAAATTENPSILSRSAFFAVQPDTSQVTAHMYTRCHEVIPLFVCAGGYTSKVAMAQAWIQMPNRSG